MRKVIAAMVLGTVLGATPALAREARVQRLYVLDCGTLAATNKAMWTPGKDENVAFTFSEQCYLIKHRTGYLLWDTGIADALTNRPMSARGMTVQRSTSLASELARIGVSPADVRYVALSHVHADHTGNVGLFPNATFIMQKSERDAAVAAGQLALPTTATVRAVEGDLDVFGDGSVMVVATPGHTAGHQSLLVRLRRTGAVILTGDAAHLESNYANGVVPTLNANAELTRSSMDRLKAMARSLKAKVWFNHDPDQAKTMRVAPKFYN